jgi:phage-related protein
MSSDGKPLVWLHGEVRSPPFSASARVEAGVLLRRLQRGEKIGLPHSRPMPSIGRRCHELRIVDEDSTWRLVYRIDSDAMVVVEVFKKKAAQTPKHVIASCAARLKHYDELSRG